jgi:hypothetical protein
MSEESALYAAATESLVSDASATNTFEKMVSVAYSHSTPGTFEKEVLETESLIKKDFELKSMPGSWRSAKSVVLGAMRLNISLVTDNGTYHGKTYLQNKIKELKAGAKEEISLTDYVSKICRMCTTRTPDHLSQEVVRDEVWQFLKPFRKE